MSFDDTPKLQPISNKKRRLERTETPSNVESAITSANYSYNFYPPPFKKIYAPWMYNGCANSVRFQNGGASLPNPAQTYKNHQNQNVPDRCPDDAQYRSNYGQSHDGTYEYERDRYQEKSSSSNHPQPNSTQQQLSSSHNDQSDRSRFSNRPYDNGTYNGHKRYSSRQGEGGGRPPYHAENENYRSSNRSSNYSNNYRDNDRFNGGRRPWNHNKSWNNNEGNKNENSNRGNADLNKEKNKDERSHPSSSNYHNKKYQNNTLESKNKTDHVNNEKDKLPKTPHKKDANQSPQRSKDAAGDSKEVATSFEKEQSSNKVETSPEKIVSQETSANQNTNDTLKSDPKQPVNSPSIKVVPFDKLLTPDALKALHSSGESDNSISNNLVDSDPMKKSAIKKKVYKPNLVKTTRTRTVSAGAAICITTKPNPLTSLPPLKKSSINDPEYVAQHIASMSKEAIKHVINNKTKYDEALFLNAQNFKYDKGREVQKTRSDTNKTLNDACESLSEKVLKTDLTPDNPIPDALIDGEIDLHPDILENIFGGGIFNNTNEQAIESEDWNHADQCSAADFFDATNVDPLHMSLLFNDSNGVLNNIDMMQANDIKNNQNLVQNYTTEQQAEAQLEEVQKSEVQQDVVQVEGVQQEEVQKSEIQLEEVQPEKVQQEEVQQVEVQPISSEQSYIEKMLHSPPKAPKTNLMTRLMNQEAMQNASNHPDDSRSDNPPLQTEESTHINSNLELGDNNSNNNNKIHELVKETPASADCVEVLQTTEASIPAFPKKSKDLPSAYKKSKNYDNSEKTKKRSIAKDKKDKNNEVIVIGSSSSSSSSSEDDSDDSENRRHRAVIQLKQKCLSDNFIQSFERLILPEIHPSLMGSYDNCPTKTSKLIFISTIYGHMEYNTEQFSKSQMAKIQRSLRSEDMAYGLQFLQEQMYNVIQKIQHNREDVIARQYAAEKQNDSSVPVMPDHQSISNKPNEISKNAEESSKPIENVDTAEKQKPICNQDEELIASEVIATDSEVASKEEEARNTQEFHEITETQIDCDAQHDEKEKEKSAKNENLTRLPNEDFIASDGDVEFKNANAEQPIIESGDNLNQGATNVNENEDTEFINNEIYDEAMAEGIEKEIEQEMEENYRVPTSLDESGRHAQKDDAEDRSTLNSSLHSDNNNSKCVLESEEYNQDHFNSLLSQMGMHRQQPQLQPQNISNSKFDLNRTMPELNFHTLLQHNQMLTRKNDLLMLQQQGLINAEIVMSTQMIDNKIFELEQRKAVLIEMIEKLNKERIEVNMQVIQLQNSKYQMLSAALSNANHINASTNASMTNLSTNASAVPSEISSLKMENVKKPRKLSEDSASFSKPEENSASPESPMAKSSPEAKVNPPNSNISDLKVSNGGIKRKLDAESDACPLAASASAASVDNSMISQNTQIDDKKNPEEDSAVSKKLRRVDRRHKKEASPRRRSKSVQNKRSSRQCSRHRSPIQKSTKTDHVKSKDVQNPNPETENVINDIKQGQDSSNIPVGLIEVFNENVTITKVEVLNDTLIAATNTGKVIAVDLFSMKEIYRIQRHEDIITDMFVSEYGKYIYTISLDGYIKRTLRKQGKFLLSATNLEEKLQLATVKWYTAFIGTKNGKIFSYNLVKNQLNNSGPLSSEDKTISAIEATKEGPRNVLFVATKEHQIFMRDANNGLLLRTFDLEDQCLHIHSIKHDGGYLYCGTQRGSIHKLDVVSGKNIMVMYSNNAAILMKNYEDKYLVVGGHDGLIYIFDKKSGKRLCEFPGAGKLIQSLIIYKDKIITSAKFQKPLIIDLAKYIN